MVSQAASGLMVKLFIGGQWRDGSEGKSTSFLDPATGESAGSVCLAGRRDVEEAVEAAGRGSAAWAETPPFERARILRLAATGLRKRAERIAELLTTEVGKPLAQARGEVMSAADTLEWFSEEGKRCFGQVIPGRSTTFHTLTRLEPVGVVAAFTPWNYPVSQSVKKLAAALAAGCAVILKGPEEAPAACAEVIKVLAESGVAPGAVNLLFGEPARISELLIAHPVVRSVSFTGSVGVGKQLAGLAGLYMKRIVMELGGHAPVIVCEDADLELAVDELVRMKFLNSGQVCLSPTRFLVARPVYREFVRQFSHAAQALRVDHGFADGVQMGPVANARRLISVKELVDDARACGAQLVCGGEQIERRGYFFTPTVLSDVPVRARAMNEEPFGPIALFRSFEALDDALVEANRLPYGLASYVYTSALRTEAVVTQRLHAGMVAVNRVFSSTIEAPFGGVRDSGYGTEGGTQAIRNFLNEKMITRSVG